MPGLGDQPEAPAPRPEPAVSIRSSIKPDYVVCLEDGKKLKMLKRHLMTHYNLTPDQYRQKWGLNADYPMVAPNYAEQRRTWPRRSASARSASARRRNKGRRPFGEGAVPAPAGMALFASVAFAASPICSKSRPT